MKKLYKLLLGIVFSSGISGYAQELKSYEAVGAGNPVLPGYFADPTIKKIGDTYYLYATTDGTGWGAGPSQVWTSKDFLNWTIQPMNWPNTHWYWAPDMTQGYDGRYYLYYSQPVEIFGAVSDTPVGPWTSLVSDNKSIIPNYMIPGVITLDAQTFTDDDGQMYMFWGTWGIYPDHGAAVGVLNKDMKTFSSVELIPNTVAKDFFEAPYMFKRNGVYYLMYSSGHCEDHTYRVQYVKSTVGPMGPFEYPAENPILVTNEDGSIHGPGHNSVLEEDGRFYIVYHRHNNPNSGGGFHRQVAIDELFFDENGNIQKVVPTHRGAKDLVKGNDWDGNIALQKPVKASSYYNQDFRPDFAVDDNNGTLWRAQYNDRPAELILDLESIQDIQTVLIQFEYPTYAYQYTLKTSVDGTTWTTYSDRSQNDRWASPVIEKAHAKARYVALEILNTQLAGLPRGVWNMKVFSKALDATTVWSDPQHMPDNTYSKTPLLHFAADQYGEGVTLSSFSNSGVLKGAFESPHAAPVVTYQGRKALLFDGNTVFKSTFEVPETMSGNSAYTVSMWVNNPTVERFEQLIGWSQGGQDLSKAFFGYGSDPQRGAITHGAWPDLGYSALPAADTWHHIAITFDGYLERIYVDGKLQKEDNRMLFVRQGTHFILGSSEAFSEAFSGYLADLKVYNIAVDPADLEQEYRALLASTPWVEVQSALLPLGDLTQLRNQGAVQSDVLHCVDCAVKAVGQHTALSFASLSGEVLSDVVQGEAYSLSFSAFVDDTWQHVYYVKGKRGVEVYVNGARSTKKRWRNLLQVEEGTLIGKGVEIAALTLKPGGTEAEDVKTAYAEWQSLQRSALKDRTASWSVAPKWINPTNLFAQVDVVEGAKAYCFQSGASSSGWITQPFYLFHASSLGDQVTVLAKDEFGHLTSVLTSPVTGTKDAVLARTLTEGGEYDFQSQASALPYWEGLHTATLVDSTRTQIRLQDGQWRLSSIHTKWGADDFMGPVLFRRVQGDFVMEVKVSDVVGLSSGTRTSNEAGLLLRDVANPRHYLTNTVLTGWNLGNLVRSVGMRMHDEANNGTSVHFDPYLQIHKQGDYIFLRSSKDGERWTDLPNSPFLRKDLTNAAMEVGIYQLSGNNQEGYGVFEQVKLFEGIK